MITVIDIEAQNAFCERSRDTTHLYLYDRDNNCVALLNLKGESGISLKQRDGIAATRPSAQPAIQLGIEGISGGQGEGPFTASTEPFIELRVLASTKNSWTMDERKAARSNCKIRIRGAAAGMLEGVIWMSAVSNKN